MRDDICTIPVSEVFEVNDGKCPICRMRDTVEEHIVDYIMGAAMMEPDVRIETNKVGFCEHHYSEMLSHRGRLQLALMLQSHIDEINKNIFTNNFLVSNSKKGERANKISESCFICDKMEFGISRMLETIYRCYENEKDFREMFNSQSAFCLVHYERLMAGANKNKLHSHYKEFCENLNRITSSHTKNLYDLISEYCTLYDYRSRDKKDVSEECKTSVETIIDFLNGRITK